MCQYKRLQAAIKRKLGKPIEALMVEGWKYAGRSHDKIKTKRNEGLIQFRKNFPHLEVPPHRDHCECGHFITENCIVVNAAGTEYIILGNVCVRFFTKDKECSTCGKTHQIVVRETCEECWNGSKGDRSNITKKFNAVCRKGFRTGGFLDTWETNMMSDRMPELQSRHAFKHRHRHDTLITFGKLEGECYHQDLLKDEHENYRDWLMNNLRRGSKQYKTVVYLKEHIGVKYDDIRVITDCGLRPGYGEKYVEPVKETLENLMSKRKAELVDLADKLEVKSVGNKTTISKAILLKLG
jgi:hypothetical protein